MPSEAWIEQLLALPNAAAQRQFLLEHVPLLDEQVAQALKGQADQFLRADVQRCLQTADLLCYMTGLTGDPLHRALGLLVEANARCVGGLGEYERAVELYDEAAAVYKANDRPVEQARSQIGKLYALAFLGHYDEALEAGQWAGRVLEAHAQWHPLADVTLNLGLIRGRMGDDAEALALFDRAGELYGQLGADGEPYLPWVDHNRAILQRNLGQFEASLQASRSAEEMLSRWGQRIEAARARQNVALTYVVLGRHNEALEILDQVRDVFVADGRGRDAILVELFISDILLQLRRFADVLETCQRAQERFSALGARFEVGQALLNEAVAHAGLRRYDEAMGTLAEARRLFTEEGNDVWVACTDLERAALLLRQERFGESLETAQACAGIFASRGQPTREAQAHLVAARASIALDRRDRALRLATEALAVAEGRDVPSLAYQAHHLLGRLAAARGKRQEALGAYERAVRELERLRGRLMVEHRADFLEDKQAVYEDAVRLCLDVDQPARALEYAERAKSRALLDLLAYRLDLSIQAREEADRPLVEELARLRTERDRLYRRWEGREEAMEEDWAAADESRQRARQDVLSLEQQITERWHRLLVRNADYARDAALWHVRTEPIQPYLDAETALLEYFCLGGQVVVFLVTRDAVRAQRLPAGLAQVQRLARLLWLNLRSVPGSGQRQVSSLAENAAGLLGQLYHQLVAPLRPSLAPCRRLIVVPHGPLHYLPFHALHDGDAYLLEGHEVSYLPGASVLRYCREARPAAAGLLALGHSYAGRLPHAVEEARAVAACLDGRAALEEEATLARLREAAGTQRVVHLAAHGVFRPDNPLFSGLALADGWLATLDVFGLRMRASLVVLSACQSGRNVVGGGDELLGLMRAFLYAGAASVVLSLWTVEDRSTAQLMETFYHKLAEGWTKGAALRYAQRQLLETGSDGGGAAVRTYAHPYFWAPFCLVGDAGPL